MLALSIGLNIYQVNAQSKLQDELEQSQERGMTFDEYRALCDDIENEIKQKYEDELEKLEESQIVFVEDDGTSLYHKFECSKFMGARYRAYKIERAISIGYKPCPDCRQE